VRGIVRKRRDQVTTGVGNAGTMSTASKTRTQACLGKIFFRFRRIDILCEQGTSAKALRAKAPLQK
jgi:hypothetical protein